MKHPSTLALALLACCSSQAGWASNPLGISYASTTNLSAYSAPTGLIIAGQCNRYDPAFAAARSAGAEVLVYLAPVEKPPANHTNCSNDLEKEFYMGDVANVPRWGLDSSGEWRVNYRLTDGTPTYMVDIRQNSVWANHVVKYIEQLMVENRVDGVFLDVLGARLWSNTHPLDTDGDGQADTFLPLARWLGVRADGTPEWPQAEKDAFTNGAVDLVRRLDASRRRLNPDFLLVNNNVWDGNGSLGNAAEPFVDGVCLENPSSAPQPGTYHANYAGRPFSNLGHRRTLIIKRNNTAVAQQWAGIAGVTHVTDQPSYLHVGTPAVGFEALNDRARPRTNGKTSYSTGTHLLTYGIKRASRYNVAQGGRVLRLGAYLDGQGESNGSMTVRMVLYTNNVDRPGSVVVQSTDVTISSGQAAGWVNFPVPANVPIAAGDYWLAIHGGPTGGKGREYADGPNNCYFKGDAFEDGTSNWGAATGTACTGTLTVYAMVAD